MFIIRIIAMLIWVILGTCGAIYLGDNYYPNSMPFFSLFGMIFSIMLKFMLDE